MRNRTLENRLLALVSAFGLDAVRETLLGIAVAEFTPSQTGIERRRSSKSATAGKKRPATANRYIRRACESRPDAEALLKKLGGMYRDRTFLKDLRDMHYFLRDHKNHEWPETRAEGLKQVMATLAGMTVPDLEKTLSHAIERDEIGDFAMLANAIMGIPNRKTN